jgi:hypothetical protein
VLVDLADESGVIALRAVIEHFPETVFEFFRPTFNDPLDCFTNRGGYQTHHQKQKAHPNADIQNVRSQHMIFLHDEVERPLPINKKYGQVMQL